MPPLQDSAAADDGNEITTSSILQSSGKFDLATVYKLTWCYKGIKVSHSPLLTGTYGTRPRNQLLNIVGLQSIHGLSGLSNLVELDLSSNSIQLISGLQHCQHLQKLVLAKNKITVVDNLWSLTKLEHLMLQANPLATIETLNLHQMSKLPRLSTLYLKAVNGTEVLDPARGTTGL